MEKNINEKLIQVSNDNLMISSTNAIAAIIIESSTSNEHSSIAKSIEYPEKKDKSSTSNMSNNSKGKDMSDTINSLLSLLLLVILSKNSTDKAKSKKYCSAMY